MSRLPAAVLLLTLLAPTGCAGGLSSNQSKGMIYSGGAAVFMGSIVSIDGLTCSDVANGGQGCDEDRSDLLGGVAIIGVGLVLGTLGYLLRPQPADESATATKKPPPPPIGLAAVPE
jgi:hypothetical protein